MNVHLDMMLRYRVCLSQIFETRLFETQIPNLPAAVHVQMVCCMCLDEIHVEHECDVYIGLQMIFL